ncbi:MAG: arginine N-succinyltransferase [Desulfatitalea sp.]|nr:arginine N-succinyltransferase [Desulfatitalea sp.]
MSLDTLVLRPVQPTDLDATLALARLAGFGMSSLPQDREVMRRKIAHAVQSFGDQPPQPEDHAFLFVLEETTDHTIVGTTGIKAHVGLSEPFYSYKLSTLVQANSDLDIYTRQRVLYMTNDFTGATEIGALFLHPDYRHSAIGQFLSRSRFLMMAEFSHLFGDTVIAELRGVHDDKGDSPFYNNLARHFFQMPYHQADYIYATRGNQFISDLMPRYPIYVALLPPAAQETIGRILPSSQPAGRILTNEGFSYEGYVDVFDGGPTLQADRGRIATVCGSRRGRVARIAPVASAQRFMLCTTVLADLRFLVDHLDADAEGNVTLSPATASRLAVGPGDAIRFSPQFPPAVKRATDDARAL